MIVLEISLIKDPEKNTMCLNNLKDKRNPFPFKQNNIAKGQV